MLSIDGGGTRGVIPLEHLRLLQDALGPDCALQDMFDLAVGTSSGASGHLILNIEPSLSVCRRADRSDSVSLLMERDSLQRCFRLHGSQAVQQTSGFQQQPDE